MEDVRTGEIYVCTGEINFRVADSIPVQITLSMRIVRDCFGNSVGDLHTRGARTGKSIDVVRATIEIDDRFKLNSNLLGAGHWFEHETVVCERLVATSRK